MENLFLFGRSPLLSWAELKAVNYRFNSPLTLTQYPSFATATSRKPIQAHSWQLTLGGVVKIYSLLYSNTSISHLSDVISTDITNSKIHSFSLSNINTDIDLQSLSGRVKALSQEKVTHSLHFRVLESPLSSAGSINKYADYAIASYLNQMHVYKAITVQDINRWDTKDFHRPAPDPRRGMMPPKISRVMVNLSLGNSLTPDTIVYDPFCGTGTILMEALELGVQVIGSDLSDAALSQTKRNLDWYQQAFNNHSSYTLFKADAAQLTVDQLPHQVDAIVFEGFLGPPHLKNTKISNLHKGLSKLYVGTLKRLHPLLKSNGRIVCALPQFNVNSTGYTFDKLIDSCEKYGYTQLVKNLSYSRPKARIKRSIYVLQKQA